MSWRRVLRDSFTDLEKLLTYLKVSRRDILTSSFPLLVPLRLAEKMEKGNIDDPLFRQFVPLEIGSKQSGFSLDPVEDRRFQITDRLLHKYEGRVLLVTTGACAMHCRYCFRQNYPYGGGRDWEGELAYIRDHTELREVILSGGDPLSLSNDRLHVLFEGLGHIPHLNRIRIHTRFPIGIPERIDKGFLSLLENSSVQPWMVIHSNHPKELDDEVGLSLKKVQRLGIPVLNQAVLLRGVNDSVETLQSLAERLAELGITFYYLHQLDRVQGAEPFEIDIPRGKELVEELSKRISGYLVPRYVQEEAGELRKTPLV